MSDQGESSSKSVNPKSEESQKGFLGSLWGGGDASQRAWGLWESVKANPTLQQAQQQAQQAWNNYDKDALRHKLSELGHSATTYIDEADRKLESLELGAVHYLQQRGTELIDKVKEGAVGEEHAGEVLFSGPERQPMSRLDAELMALNASPDQILSATSTASATSVPEQQRKEYLDKSADLESTHKLLVPAKMSEDAFWNSYISLKSNLETQDQRRKQLIQSQGQEDQHELDDWGSSDEEEEVQGEGKESQASVQDKDNETNTASAAKTEKKSADGPEEPPRKKDIEEEGSDSDWE